MSTTIQDRTAEAAEPVTPERRPRCRRLITIKDRARPLAARLGPPAREQCSAEVADPNHESKLCQQHLAAALRDLLAAGVVHLADQCDAERRQAAAVAELMDLAGRSRNATSMAEQVELNNRMVQVARAEAEERHARSDRLVEDLLAPKPAETAATRPTGGGAE